MKPTKISQKAKRTHLATAVKRELLKLAETKVYSTQGTAATITTAGTVINLTNNIVEGDDIGNRSGTKILLKHIRYYFNAFAVTTSQSFRFILFRDLFNQGTTPAVGELLPNANWFSQYSDVHQIQQKRFVIIEDWMVDSNLSGQLIVSREKDKAIGGVVMYNGPTAQAGFNGKGALFLLVIGSSTTGTYNWSVQIQYNDS